ncbi:helix-turn-helix domain-containing protein [Actinomadura physcomitrii]|nr:helix-turn-helix transcriptional regulator [Actinomadura physcomitrii]
MTTSPPPRPGRGPGRPAKPLNPSASLLAHLGAELRRARLQRGLTLIRLGELTGYSWQHLGNVERGRVVPTENVVLACERALSAGGRLASLLPGVIREQAAQRHAREAARHHADPAPEEDIDWSRLAAAAARPSAVTVDMVAELEAITDRQRRLYHELTSAQMSVPVEAHLGLLIALLGNASSTALRHRIASAAGEAAGFAGWIWHDLGDPHKSALYYRTARDLFPEAGNPALASYISGYQALASEAEGHADDAVHHARQALDTAPKATTRLTLSWLSALTAGTLAATGRRDGSLALLHQEEEHFDAAQDREEWMYEFDRTALADYRGQCHLRLGHAKEAITAFSEDWPCSRPPANGAAPRSPSASPKPTSATAGSTRPPTPHTARWRSSPPAGRCRGCGGYDGSAIFCATADTTGRQTRWTSTSRPGSRSRSDPDPRRPGRRGHHRLGRRPGPAGRCCRLLAGGPT